MGPCGNCLLLPALVLALCATVLATSDAPKGVILGTGHTVGFGELQVGAQDLCVSGMLASHLPTLRWRVAVSCAGGMAW